MLPELPTRETLIATQHTLIGETAAQILDKSCVMIGHFRITQGRRFKVSENMQLACCTLGRPARDRHASATPLSVEELSELPKG